MRELAQVVWQYEKSHRMALRNCMASFHSDFGEFVPHTSITHKRLIERNEEIVEKKATRRQSAVAKLEAAKKDVRPPTQSTTRASRGMIYEEATCSKAYSPDIFIGHRA